MLDLHTKKHMSRGSGRDHGEDLVQESEIHGRKLEYGLGHLIHQSLAAQHVIWECGHRGEAFALCGLSIKHADPPIVENSVMPWPSTQHLLSLPLPLPSPLVPTQENYFVWHYKQHPDGIWAIIDVSLQASEEDTWISV
eukprot:Gb_21802 [translate_table: standard]